MTDASPPPDVPQTAHKAWWATIATAGLSALVTAAMVTWGVADLQIHIIWTWWWCDPAVTDPNLGIVCPTLSSTVAWKGLIETFGDQWLKAIIAGGVLGPAIGAIVYNVKNNPKA